MVWCVSGTSLGILTAGSDIWQRAYHFEFSTITHILHELLLLILHIQDFYFVFSVGNKFIITKSSFIVIVAKQAQFSYYSLIISHLHLNFFIVVLFCFVIYLTCTKHFSHDMKFERYSCLSKFKNLYSCFIFSLNLFKLHEILFL